MLLFVPLSTLFYYLLLDFYVKTGIRFSFRDKRLFEITEVEITRVDCTSVDIPSENVGINLRFLSYIVGIERNFLTVDFLQVVGQMLI